MEIKHFATAGTLESSDCLVTLDAQDAPTEITIKSSVIQQYGEDIRKTIEEVLSQLDVSHVKLEIEDKGALDCTIRSRVETAVFRAADTFEGLPWGSKL
ncbi:MAG: citrate lyase acyl carrier protein [Peptoniphilaceae bacterium]|nr:citrate lyase acyl carrier protein [Peptoniphilaceae bacterium]MDY6085413.1 citrate lyase acyl carrier protein [Peptoniphilaceae bacterium]